jgi:hypothetical protein
VHVLHQVLGTEQVGFARAWCCATNIDATHGTIAGNHHRAPGT